ncbi:MAG: hypothetical protein IBX56_20220 [Methylomicrobium sp.]|nr:hypothetical protein [Methylomicrobium sp.]
MNVKRHDELRVTLTDAVGAKLVIYKVEGFPDYDPRFCIGEPDGDHFCFSRINASEVMKAIDDVIAKGS